MIEVEGALPQAVQMSKGDLTESLVITPTKQVVLSLEDGRGGLTRQPLIVAVQFSQQKLILSGVLSGERMALVGFEAYMTATAELGDEPCQL